MSDATLLQCAAAIAAELLVAVEAEEFGADIETTPDWSFATFDEVVKKADGLRIDVVPKNYDESGLSSRTRIGYASSCDVYVRKRFNDVTDRQANANNQIKRAEIARLIRLVQDIHERFIKRRLPTMESASWRSSTVVTAYSRVHLRTNAMFWGNVRFVYDTPEPVPEIT